MKKDLLFGLSISLSGLLLFSCNSNQQEKGEITAEDTANASAPVVTEQLPSPIEMAILIKQSGAKYNQSLPNNIKNVDKYSTSAAKALNLGVYCADVGYSTLFKQNQETMFFLNNCRKLSDDLGLTTAFDKTVFDRIEANIDKRDSLLGIITETYATSSKFLKENNRYGTFMLMMAGGWVESMHLACNMAKDKGVNADIALKIAEQEASLEKIIKAMDQFKSDNAVNVVMLDLISIKKILAEGKLAIQNGDNIQVDEKLLESVTLKIKEVRSGMVGA
ncbi:MAG: hypothetical protein K1X82_09825 [Bacteroidia bacterium]|nr:hypothetical protein [Bacteroidia bacterium]